MKILKLLLFAWIFIPALTSCRSEKVIWAQARTFQGDRWQDGEPVVFLPDSGYFDEKTSGKAILSIRYGKNFPMESFPVIIETESPAEGKFRSETKILHFLPGNQRDGDHSTLGVFEMVDTLSLSPAPADGWSLTLKPALDTLQVSPIYSVALQIIE